MICCCHNLVERLKLWCWWNLDFDSWLNLSSDIGYNDTHTHNSEPTVNRDTFLISLLSESHGKKDWLQWHMNGPSAYNDTFLTAHGQINSWHGHSWPWAVSSADCPWSNQQLMWAVSITDISSADFPSISFICDREHSQWWVINQKSTFNQHQ